MTPGDGLQPELFPLVLGNDVTGGAIVLLARVARSDDGAHHTSRQHSAPCAVFAVARGISRDGRAFRTGKIRALFAAISTEWLRGNLTHLKKAKEDHQDENCTKAVWNISGRSQIDCY